jgi:hypothetical protein
MTCEVDTDGDGTGDDEDAFPLDPTETVDTDGDDTGDNVDAFPLGCSADARTCTAATCCESELFFTVQPALGPGVLLPFRTPELSTFIGAVPHWIPAPLTSSEFPSSGFWPETPSAADLNGDEHVDVFIRRFHSSGTAARGQHALFLGDGVGGYVEAVDSTLRDMSGAMTDVAFADFNKDGYTDVFATNTDFGVNFRAAVDADLRANALLFGDPDATGGFTHANITASLKFRPGAEENQASERVSTADFNGATLATTR